MPQGGFVATVVFRSREARFTKPLIEDSVTPPPHGTCDNTGATDVGTPSHVSEVTSSATAPSPNLDSVAGEGISEPDAVGEVSDPVDPDANNESPHDFGDTIQLWTFRAEHPNLGPYMQWLRSKYKADLSITHEESEPPVRWQLTDIVRVFPPPMHALLPCTLASFLLTHAQLQPRNTLQNFSVHDYESANYPKDPSEAVNEIIYRAVATGFMGLVTAYLLYRVLTRERAQRPRPYAPGMREHGQDDRRSGSQTRPLEGAYATQFNAAGNARNPAVSAREGSDSPSRMNDPWASTQGS